ncbi:MAG: hypothetical protein K8S87_03940 [Planctomycetes bacterium]|nr:hypothetical protein [Planctomycetota bacterium]
MFKNKAKLSLVLALLIVIALPAVGKSVLNAAPKDIIIFKKDLSSNKAQVIRANGNIESMDLYYVVYETDSGRSRFRPWEIEWIKFGGVDNTSDENTYNDGVESLRKASWKKAALIFASMLKHVGRNKTGPVWKISKKERRSMVLYTTYYYHGYALLQQGLEKQNKASHAYAEVLKIFPIGLSRFATTTRQEDFDKNPEKLETVKNTLKERIVEVQTLLSTSNTDETQTKKITDYIEKIDAVKNAKNLEVAVGKFMDICKGFFAADFRAAIDTLKEPFILSSLDSQALNFKIYPPMIFYNIKLAIAQAYFGLREFNNGAAEIDEALTRSLESSNIIKPSLKEIIFEARKKDKKFYNYLIDGYRITAEAFESKPDFKEARKVYFKILQTIKDVNGFENVTNDTQLSIALCEAKMGKTEDAVETLNKLLRGFAIDRHEIPRKWDNKNLIKPTDSSLYMGVYMTFGEVYYDTYSRSNNKNDLFKSFEAYQKVTSYFASDDLKRAKALYWLVRIAQEIALEVFGKYAKSKDKLASGKINPYKYYMDLASQYQKELKSHYSYTEWVAK